MLRLTVKSHKTNSLALEEPIISMPKNHSSNKAIAKQTQAKVPTTHEDEKICSGTFYDRWFCSMEYFSMKSVLRYAKSYATLRIDKICYVFVSPALQNLM